MVDVDVVNDNYFFGIENYYFFKIEFLLVIG